MKRLQIWIGFYSQYRTGPLLLTLACCVLYFMLGDLYAQLATKLATDAAILYFIFSLDRDKLYYYYNQHISKRTLIAAFIITDMLLFCICLWMTDIIMHYRKV